jgi:hypothetical protein
MAHLNLPPKFVAPPRPTHMDISMDFMSSNPLGTSMECDVSHSIQEVGLPLII